MTFSYRSLFIVQMRTSLLERLPRRLLPSRRGRGKRRRKRVETRGRGRVPERLPRRREAREERQEERQAEREEERGVRMERKVRQWRLF